MWEIDCEIFNTIFAPKSTTLRIFGSNKVMVPIVNTFEYVVSYTSSSSFVMSFIKS
jgi:hypothetical protein